MNKNPRIVFFGTPEIADIVLQDLLAGGYIPALLVCNPDRPQGRKKIITPPPTKRTAEMHHIPVYQPEKKPDADEIRLHVSDADLFLVCAYSKIIPQSVLNIPVYGTIGIHPSLLPEFRGASPIQSAILSGKEKTGVTLYHMDAEIDHGDMIDQEVCDITFTDTTPTLSEKLAHLASRMLIRDIQKIIQKEIEYVSQDHASATFTKKFKTNDGYIPWEDMLRAEVSGGEIAREIHRKIRAFYGDPGAWTKNPEGKRIKLWESEIQDGKLKLKVIQEEGKQKTAI